MRLNSFEAQEENTIDDMASGLYRRIEAEIEKLLRSQLEKLGVIDDAQFLIESGNFKKYLYPGDPNALCAYEYKGQKILGVRISENMVCVEFDVPNVIKIETQTKGEVQ